MVGLVMGILFLILLLGSFLLGAAIIVYSIKFLIFIFKKIIKGLKVKELISSKKFSRTPFYAFIQRLSKYQFDIAKLLWAIICGFFVILIVWLLVDAFKEGRGFQALFLERGVLEGLLFFGFGFICFSSQIIQNKNDNLIEELLYVDMGDTENKKHKSLHDVLGERDTWKKDLLSKENRQDKEDKDRRIFWQRADKVREILYDMETGKLKEVQFITEDVIKVPDYKFFADFWQKMDALNEENFALESQLAWIKYNIEYNHNEPKIEDYYVLGLMYEEGINHRPNKKKALEYYQKALTTTQSRSQKQNDYIKIVNDIQKRIEKLMGIPKVKR